jgi:hypothetical protein
MQGFPVELLYVLAFVGFVLFNYFVNRAARRRQQEEQALEAERPAPPPAQEEEPFEDYWGRTTAPSPAPAPAVVVSQPVRSAPPPPPARRSVHPVRALLNDKRDLRRAVVLMVVLGPCRAQEPLEPSGPQPQDKP